MSESITLLVLSFNRRNLELLTKVLEKANYQVIGTSNYQNFQAILSNYTCISLALIDLCGCDNRIGNYCDRLREKNIQFLTFAPKYSRAVEQSSLARGASSVLVKPLAIENLLLLIHSLVGDSEL